MSASINIDILRSEGLLPSDSKIISEHNNTVVASERERLVSRVAHVAAMASREDPGDIAYSHRLAWNMGCDGGVVAPLHPEPIFFEDVVISSYPMMDLVSWNEVSAHETYNTVQKFNSFSLDREPIKLRRMDVTDYAQRRLDYVAEADSAPNHEVDHVRKLLEVYRFLYPFHQLTDEAPALVHGDLHTGNLVATPKKSPLLIDLDSAAIGPAQYDLASWHVRSARGDGAPTQELVELTRKRSRWNEESFRALMGWKVLSSMTHTLRYEKKESQPQIIEELSHIATILGAPGEWRELDVLA